MKRPLADRILEQFAMLAVVLIAFVGLGLCADESTDKPLSTYFWQSVVGIGLFGFAFWLGRELRRKGIITNPEDNSPEL